MALLLPIAPSLTPPPFFPHMMDGRYRKGGEREGGGMEKSSPFPSPPLLPGFARPTRTMWGNDVCANVGGGSGGGGGGEGAKIGLLLHPICAPPPPQLLSPRHKIRSCRHLELTPNHQRWYAKWKLSWNTYILRTHFHTFCTDLYAQLVLISKISASELSRKFIKSALLVGLLHCQYTVQRRRRRKKCVKEVSCFCVVKQIQEKSGTPKMLLFILSFHNNNRALKIKAPL